MNSIKAENSYKEMKQSFFGLKKILSYSCPLFEELLTSLSLKCLNEAQQAEQEKAYQLFEEAYILLKDLLENICKWYRINPEEEEIPYFYGWKYAELGKVAYYLSELAPTPKAKAAKIKKAAEYT